jgi:SHS2 domain-containing protein
MKYKIIDHTADFGLHVFGADPQDLFANAARAMFELITDPQTVNDAQTLTVTVEGGDWPDLMVNWLRELLYLWAGRELLVGAIDIQQVSDKKVTAIIAADRFDPQRHPVQTEIKAVTYHQIQVKSKSTGWEAKIIFDV